MAWVPKPMHASVIFSLGATAPGPPSTWRGTMLKALATAPVASMNLRRERPRALERDPSRRPSPLKGGEGGLPAVLEDGFVGSESLSFIRKLKCSMLALVRQSLA